MGVVCTGSHHAVYCALVHCAQDVVEYFHHEVCIFLHIPDHWNVSLWLTSHANNQSHDGFM